MGKKDKTSTKDEMAKMSPKVQIRYNNFLIYKNKMEEDGYVVKNLTFNPVLVNVLAILLSIPLLILVVLLYYRLGGRLVVDKFQEMNPLFLFIVLFAIYTVLTIIHELIHGLVGGLCAKDGFKKVEFGMNWKFLTPYCTIQSSLKKWQYILGAIMPTVVLGFIPFAISAYLSSTLLFALSLGMILGGIGDFMVIFRLLTFWPRNKEVVYMDHPYKCGLVAFLKDKETSDNE